MFNQHESTVFDNLVALIMDARKLQVSQCFVIVRGVGLFPVVYCFSIARSVPLP